MNRATDSTVDDVPVSKAHDESLEIAASTSIPESSDPVIDELAAVARAHGIDLDPDASRQWLAAVADATAAPGEFSRSHDGEFGGHELAMIDFDPTVADRLRRIGRVIESPPTHGLKSALAIAGSSAQGRIQPFPADADFFERLHIAAPRRKDAVALLADAVHLNVTLVGQHQGFLFEEVYFGHHAGLTLCWTLAEFAFGRIARTTAIGQPVELTWLEAAADPGFVKIDWMLDDPVLGGPGRVSKVIDATWETPEGDIVSLDGAIDADFQQVYLDAEAADLAAALTSGLAPGSREHYVYLMEREIVKYCDDQTGDFAKVAKRLYNLCRLTGRFAEAAFVRELFDEPPARLHQIRVRLELAGRLSATERIALAHELIELANAEQRWCAETDRMLLNDLAERFRAKDVLSSMVFDSASEEARRVVSAAFARGLRAYAPVAQLLEEIRSRHAAAMPPR